MTKLSRLWRCWPSEKGNSSNYLLEPLAKGTLHQRSSLCDQCSACVRACGTSIPSWLHSQGYFDGLQGVEAEERRPKYSHLQYKAFASAVRGGCFICNTVLESFLHQHGSSPDIRLRRHFERIGFGRTYIEDIDEFKVFACRLDFVLFLRRGRTRVDVSFTLTSHKAPTPNPEVKHVASGSTNSDRSWDFALQKLKQCTQNHSCGPQQVEGSKSWYPTRLIDVGAPESDRDAVKLIETSRTQPEGPFVTLSHCWGDASLVHKLTTAGRENLLDGLPPLSTTFENAILATRKLGVRYIWIDCLCIIQDDLADWERESMLMSQVYRNALCNIAGTASKDSQGGLFYDRGDILSGISVNGDEDKPMVLLRDDCGAVSDTEAAPLQSRGWVLQERLLSPRIIHFSSRQLVWECDVSRASESFPDGLPLAWPVTKRIGPDKDTITEGGIGDSSDDRFLKLWGDILERYTATRLTYRSDLMPALSGIAKHLQDISGAVYLAGIWQPSKGFEAHLAWHCKPPLLPRPKEYRAPSWSWASTDNRIVLNPITPAEEGWGNSSLEYVICKARILDVQMTVASSNPFGSASSGFLLLTGPLNKITMLPDVAKPSLGGQALDMEVFLDEPLTAEKDLYTLPLFRYWSCNPYEYGWDIQIFTYLILAVSDEHSGCYARAGLGRMLVDQDGDSNQPEIWNKVVNAMDAPCEEFQDQDTGHRIRII